MRPEDFKHDDGYWVFSDKKLYLVNGSMMNRIWLSLTELMRRRPDLTDDFLLPMRKKLEKSLSIPQAIIDEVDEDLKIMYENETMDEYLNKIGVRRLRDGEKINKGK